MLSGPGSTGSQTSRWEVFGTDSRLSVLMFVTILSLLIALLVFGQTVRPVASGGLQYVASSGSDSNDGSSQTAAVRTWARAETNLGCIGTVSFSLAYKAVLSSDPFSRFHRGGCRQTIHLGVDSLITTNVQIVVPDHVNIVGGQSAQIIAGNSFPTGTTIEEGDATRALNVVTLATTIPHKYPIGTLLSLSGFKSVNGPCVVLASSVSSLTCKQAGPDVASDGGGSVSVPLIVVGDGFDFPQPDLYGGQTMLRFVVANCDNLTGTIGFYSDQIQEKGGLEHIEATGCTAAGIRIEQFGQIGGGSPQNFTLRDLYVIMGSAAPRTARGVEFVGSSGYLTDRSGVQGATVVGPADTMAAGVYTYGAEGMRFASIHCENVADCVQIGRNSAGITLDNLMGHSSVKAILHIENSADIKYIDARAIVSNSATLSIRDDSSRAALKDSVVGWYDYIEDGRCFTSQYSAACTQPTQMTAGRVRLSRGVAVHVFAAAYRSAPICTASDTTRAAPVTVTSTRSVVTINGNGNDVVAWICTPTAN